MKFKIPFTLASVEILKKKSRFFSKYVKYKKDSNLTENLENSQIDITRKEYLGVCLRTLMFSFLAFFILSTTILAFLSIPFYYLWGTGLSLVFAFFIYFSQVMYPKVFVGKRQRNIEKNLLAAMSDILVQLNSGIPLFSVLVNISAADYGELSEEFKKAVKKINAGSPEQVVLEDLSKKNPSVFFKRTLWQISNGMNAGSNMAIVVRDNIRALNEEQLIQIQNYGNKLNPLVVFYMLAAIIVPALSITFLTILSSMVSLPKSTTQMMFFGLFIGVVFIQIMFLGIIKSKRPSLL